MAYETRAELRSAFRRESGLPTANDELASDNSDVDQYLSLGQQAVFRQLATTVPGSQVAAPEKLTTADGGYTYTFAYYPFGHAEIRSSRTGSLLIPGAESDPGADFVQEGQTIRFTNYRARTFDDGPYARYAPTPPDISASQEPTLKPNQARVLILYKALDLWATKGGYRDPTPFRNMFRILAFGDPETPGDVGIIGALRRQFWMQGGSGVGRVSSDLAGWAAQGNLSY